MRILFYIPFITREDGGVYQYAVQILKHLIANSKKDFHTYVLMQQQDAAIAELIMDSKNATLIPESFATETTVQRIFRNVTRTTNDLSKRVFHRVFFKYISDVDYLIRRYRISLLYSPHQYIPEHLDIPSVVTMHDLQELHFPEYFTPKERMRRAIQYKYSIENAEKVIVSYSHIKEDIIKYFHKNPDDIPICFPGIQHAWFETMNERESPPVKEICSFPQYILYPAASWPHKNHINLLRAIAELKKENHIVHLVCTGSKNNFYDHISAEIYRLNLVDQVMFLGIVPDETLLSLYINARAVVLPTKYEAGSYPLMESMLLRVPVICSEVTSLPDTIGSDEYLFDPDSISEIRDKIKQVCFDDNFCKRNIENSIARSTSLKNPLLFEHLYEVFERALKRS